MSKIEYIEECASTNDVARDKKYTEGDIIVAERQTAGRGQRGNSWESEEGLNLTFSMVLQPTFLPPDMQFMLSECVSLAMVDMLDFFHIEAKIKWPNDIYVGDRKISGILIENDITGNTLSRSIVGIGLNVNQRTFPADVPNAISMAGATGLEYDRKEVLKLFQGLFMMRYVSLEVEDITKLDADYHLSLYRFMKHSRYALPDGRQFTGTIQRVMPSGELLMEHSDGTIHSYLFKEMEFVV
jgi:BirA family biotin operon repressor/biotin-[acetyl-CoA-carboxylase] ligase